MILDEPFTHLDGEGRRRVGRLLKGMLKKSVTDEELREDDGPSGGLDTIMIILQDLAADEMEEAFDHIDIVSKDAVKGSTVFIDGGS